MKLYISIFLILPLFSFGQTDFIESIAKSKIIHETENPVHSILLYIEDVDKKNVYHKGFGKRDRDEQDVTKNNQFKIASSTKLFVATIILQLVEEGKLKLNDKASQFIKNVEYLDFDKLHIFKEKSYANEITIEHLLSHRSGLADIFSDKEDEFFNFILQNQQRQFSPRSIVELYYRFNLNKDPHFKPNEGWYYSDMNYVLIGLIIEQIEQITLSESIRKRIIDPLEMNDTFFEYYEVNQPKNNLISQYVGNINFKQINTSFDWSGGGLVSTNKDLAKFIKSLFNLKLINNRSLNNMIDVKFTNDQENRYGLGIYESKYNGSIYFGHYGFYGTYIGYCPKTNHVISYSISQAKPHFNVSHFIEETLKLMK